MMHSQTFLSYCRVLQCTAEYYGVPQVDRTDHDGQSSFFPSFEGFTCLSPDPAQWSGTGPREDAEAGQATAVAAGCQSNMSPCCR